MTSDLLDTLDAAGSFDGPTGRELMTYVYTAYCNQQKLEPVSADEHIAGDTITDPQRLLLSKFIALWEAKGH